MSKAKFNPVVPAFVVSIFGGGCIVAGLLGTEVFPFSAYPMYSRTTDTTRLEALTLVGVRQDDGSEWVVSWEKIRWRHSDAMNQMVRKRYLKDDRLYDYD